MSSPTDFNLSPYYDDFAESKSFHRILFRPAFAVQARELTQSQTILQNQVEKLGDHFFEKGAMVIPGEIGYDLKYYAVKLSSIDSTNTLAHFTNGTVLTGSTSGVVATIVNQSATDGTDPDTLFVKYSKSGGNNKNEFKFADGETITGTNSDSVNVTAIINTCATGSAAQVQAGSYYINGFMVNVAEQTIILDKYTDTPSYRVGLLVTESFVTPTQDNTLNDNAQGVSNTNAPGAHRFKIDLTLTKKAIGATDDANFVELLRLSAGILQNQVRTTEYAVLEDTFARRTFDESGDYSIRDFDLDLREHLISANNRGIYTAANGGLESKIAAGLAPGKAYVRGYEIETIGTRYVDIDKARDFETQNAFPTRFDVGNFVNVTNVYNTPDYGSVTGETLAFRNLHLYNEPTAVRGTGNSGSGASIYTIGRAKTKGFEYKSGTAAANIYSSASLTTSVFKHYLFDINMFTHLNINSNVAFTKGEKITGDTSGASATVEDASTVSASAVSSISIASPGVASATAHGFKEGQQIRFSAISAQDQTVVITTNDVFTVRNPNTNDFELYRADGITPTNINQYTSSGNALHGVVIVSSVNGEFAPDEVIRGSVSSKDATIQSDSVGFKGVRSWDFSAVKQVYGPGTATYSADTSLDTNGENAVVSGFLDIANGSAAVTGVNTKFTTELKVGDSISFTNDSGNTETKRVEAIISDNSLTLGSVVAAQSTKTVATRRRAKLQDSNKNISIFKLPYDNIKTLKTASNSNITDTSFAVRRQFIVTLSGGSGQITAGTNENFPSSANDSDYVISIDDVASATNGATGDILTTIGNNHEGNPIFTQPSGSGTSVFDFGSNYANAKIKIIATVNRSTAGSKSKTLVSGSTKDVTSLADCVKQGGINLGKADIFQLTSVKMATAFGAYSTSGEIDITDRYDLDNGQRDNYYDLGRIKLKTGELEPTGSLRIMFDFLTHGSGDYFDIDSYSGVVDYANILSYTSDTTGQTLELRDCLDFRPRVADNSTINAGEFDRDFDTTQNASIIDVIKFGTDITADFEYYLPRIDKIFLDKEGVFKVLKGASALDPQVPKSLDGAMHLYTLDIPAYTLSTDDIKINIVDNRRYTMRDIGKLESRIENVEYYTQLSLLETAAQNLQIQDGEGFDRFKNGFIVDNFTGHNVGDPKNRDYKAAMDMAKGELRPTFSEDAVKLIEADEDGTAILAADRTAASYQKTGDCLTLPYTESTLIDQPFASKTVNVNPFDVFNWSGSIALTPPSDEWKETNRAPQLVINNTGAFDSLVSGLPIDQQNQGIEIGSVWNEWQDMWSGSPADVSSRDVGGARRSGRRVFTNTEITTQQSVNQTRTGVRQRLVPQTVRNSIGDRIVNVAFVPFVRSRTINFTATRMKPNTRVYAFFDDVSIASYVTPSSGANLDTDNNGSVSGTFVIPDPAVNSNPRWRTGTRTFRLTSSQNDTRFDVETSAESDYVARGILETVQNTIISTREPQLVRTDTTSDRTINRVSTRQSTRTIGWVDPLAQTFMVDDPGGVFLTSMDMYFGSKDANIPITLQIREVVNGYPGSVILPFSEKTINPNAVSTSTDGTTATTFTFDSPVYIQENTEYCFVLLANSNNYTAYVGRLGEKVLGSDRTISQQPYAGVMFKSQNGSTWTAEQNEDVKFKIKRAEFSNVTGTATLVNEALPVKTLKNNPIRTLSDSSAVLRISHPNHGMHGTSNNVTIAGVPTGGALNGLSADQINGTYTQISNVTLDSYDVNPTHNSSFSGSIVNPNGSGDIGSNAVTATQNRLYDVLNLSIQTMTVSGTNLSYSMRPTTGKSISGGQSEFSLTSTASSENVIAGDNIYFTAPQMVASSINETNEMSGSKSLFVNCVMTTSNTKLSPVIDLQRCSAFAVQNRLNQPSASDVNYVADTANVGTSSAAVYLTKPVVLENLSTAIDVRLTSNIRSTSSVEVYFRTTSSEEARNIDDLSWIPFNTTGTSDSTVTPSEDNETFKEYKYSKTGINEFTAFQIKIVMKGTNSAYPPVIRDMRGIALAV
nr:VrlC protein [uncultured Mediterranean phage uvMED]